MAWRVGCLLVGVLAWAVGGVPESSPSLSSTIMCDVETLRCDVICSFPDLGLHCSRCARRTPMRFGKRAGNTRTQNTARPFTSSGFVPSGGDSRTHAAPADALLPDRASRMDGLRFVARPHLFLSKIFWRNSVGQNFPASQERKVTSWRSRKKCLLSAHDPARCPPESVFRNLFRITDNHESRREEESNDSLCDTQLRQCSPGSDTSGKHSNAIDTSRTHPLEGTEFDKDLRTETGRRRRFNDIEASRIPFLNGDDYSERFNSIDSPRRPSFNTNGLDTDLRGETGRSNIIESLRPFSSDDFDTDLRSREGRSRRLNDINTSNQRSFNTDDFDKDLIGIGSSRTHPFSSYDFDDDLRSRTARRRHTHSFHRHGRENERHKRRWRSENEPAEHLRPGEIDYTGAEDTHDTKDFDPGRRMSRRSVVEEVVEGLMEMLHLEILPVDPKQYGCHDLPFPGVE